MAMTDRSADKQAKKKKMKMKTIGGHLTPCPPGAATACPMAMTDRSADKQAKKYI